MRQLNDLEIQEIAPSVFADSPKGDVSDKYEFVPTKEVLSKLRGDGWMVSRAQEQRSVIEENQGFNRHMLRFFKDDFASVGAERFELVLINSHNRSAAYQLMAGVFRLVCSNGMIVGDTVSRMCVKHIGTSVQEILAASYEVADQAPLITGKIDQFKSIDLSNEMRSAYAESATLLMYDDVSDAPFKPERLLTMKRRDDDGSDLWTTFNTVQENVMKGGIRGSKWVDKPTGGQKLQRTKTRAIKSIDRDTKLNKALWNLTEKMAELKG